MRLIKTFSGILFEGNDTSCVKSVRIRSYSDPYFPVFELNTERYSVCQCGKIRTRLAPNTDTFYAVTMGHIYQTVCKMLILNVFKVAHEVNMKLGFMK